MSEEELIETLKAFDKKRVEQLNENARNLFYAIMKVCDDRDNACRIINEFDKWLLGEQMMFYRGSDNERLIRYGETKYKWLELKGSDKE